mgnify:CR=1 FL=1
MNGFYLGWKNLTYKPLSLLLSLLLFALGTGLISLLLVLNHQLQEKFEKNLAGIDLVVGAKGSPLQLILSSMYHIDAPTGNVPIEEVKAFLRPGHPLIERAVPLSLGDSHQGFRIVGTTHDFLDLYQAELASGDLWSKDMEVTIGATVADQLKLKLGDQFSSSHGFVIDPNLVHDHPTQFNVVGILQPTGAVIDQLILTNTRSIWEVHEHAGAAVVEEAGENHEDHDHEGDTGHDHSEEPIAVQPAAGEKPLYEETGQSITSLLIQFKGRNIQTLNMQRSINENTNQQAATPAIEINRLYSNLGVGMDALRVLALVIVAVSAFSIFISLFSSLRERRYELAVMRVMGATPGKLLRLILTEGILIAVIGCSLGLLLSHLSMNFLAQYMTDTYRYSFSGWTFLKAEAWLFLGAVGVGVLAAIIPALQASRADISDTLAE